MELGAFSVSLAVKDLEASKRLYEKLGFVAFMGEVTQNWLILKEGDRVFGLFQGMFEKNTLTFNPGWDGDANPVESFTDIRELERELKAQGVESSPKSMRPAPGLGASSASTRTAIRSSSTSTSDEMA